MGPFLLTITVYFLISSVMTGFIVFTMRRLGKDHELNIFEVAVVFLVAPLVLGIQLVLHWLFPPSGDPFDVVYTKLSYFDGKDSTRVAAEIKAAGQTVGGVGRQERRVEDILSAMLRMGFARSKEVPVSEPPVDEDPVPGLEEKVAVLSQDTKNEEVEDAPEIVTLYYRGNPPPKNGGWRHSILSHLRPAMT